MKTSIFIVHIIFVTICLIALTGCGGINTITSSGASTFTKVGDVFLDNQISVEDIQINSQVSPKQYNIKIRNRMWFQMVLEVKMDFYDGNGVKLDNPWGWKALTIEPKQDEWVKFTAPSDQSNNFKLYVQKAEN